ncbi:MAG: septal ring lytic transglycosylase RlpA family protein [Porticoccaceae bacterium]
MFPVKPLAALLAMLLLAGCFGTRGPSGASADRDGPPGREIDGDYPDVTPRPEPITRAGNKNPYTVLGKTYHLLPTAAGYREIGVASWYGAKFHGRATSNGEPYDMFAMTAAHKTLPIPAYVRVTNLENDRSAIVRVNDRGPFHGDRIIDLSYAAAKKLGVLNPGTARVEVVAIDPSPYQRNSVEVPRISAQASQSMRLLGPAPADIKDGPPLAAATAGGKGAPSPGAFLQVGSFASLKSARSLQARVEQRVATPALVRSTRVAGRDMFRVLIGPFVDTAQLRNAQEVLVQAERLDPFVVQGVNL